MKDFTVALVGNPNCGKTSLFNALTGESERVGNYSGVTVQVAQGQSCVGGVRLNLLDLPGSYSLVPSSPDEAVTVDFLNSGKADLIVVVLDAGNLERNLYLLLQVLEMGTPVVCALNMVDEVRQRGLTTYPRAIEATLGIPVVETVGSRGGGLHRLRSTMVDAVVRKQVASPRKFQPDVESFLEAQLSRWGGAEEGDQARITLIRRLEAGLEEGDALFSAVKAAFSAPIEVVLAGQRYELARKLAGDTLQGVDKGTSSLTERLDRLTMHPLLGLPIFLAVIYMVFWMTFRLGEVPMHWMEEGLSWLQSSIHGAWPAGSPDWLRSVLVDGALGGVGGVLVFLPNLLILFFALSLMEFTGYMARATFLMDGLMQRVGLQGRSFVPMVLGLGCSVPAIMAARSIEDERDRLATILAIPLVPCGARLPIFLLLIPAFFPVQVRGLMLFLVYLTGMATAIGVAFFLRKRLFAGESPTSVLEVPPYRRPRLRSVFRYTWFNGWLYLRKAGTVILVFSVVFWVLANYPKPSAEEARESQRVCLEAGATEDLDGCVASQSMEHSALGMAGQFLVPVFRPLGFDWRISTSVLGSLGAKEVFVAQMAVLFSMETAGGDRELTEVLRGRYSVATGSAVLFFMLLTFPCLSTLAVTWRETGRRRYALLQFALLFSVAWVVAASVYQIVAWVWPI